MGERVYKCVYCGTAYDNRGRIRVCRYTIGGYHYWTETSGSEKEAKQERKVESIVSQYQLVRDKIKRINESCKDFNGKINSITLTNREFEQFVSSVMEETGIKFSSGGSVDGVMVYWNDDISGSRAEVEVKPF